MQYISTKEASENWGVTEQLVRRYCRQEHIPGVIQKDGAWLIPAKARKPSRIDFAEPEEEIAKLLYTDLCQNDNIIFAGVRGNYSPEIATMFTNAVFVKVPKEIRMERVRSRAFNKFGDRVLQGGDLYEREKAFYDIIEKRTDEVVTDWLETLNIPVIAIDGRKPIEENVDLILEILK